jgi:hypothetical protein
MNDDLKKAILEKLTGQSLSSPGVRSRIAASMIAPLRERRDYQSLGRRTFLVEELGFRCAECGFSHPDKGYVHPDDECAVYGIMES